MSETFPIFAFDTQQGVLTVEKEGLYYRLKAVLPDEGTLIRVYLVGEDGTVLLGTAVPEQGKLVCRKTLSHRQMPKKPLAAMVYAARWQSWRPDSQGGLRRMSDQWVEQAQPYEAQKPVQHLEHYCRLQSRKISGRTYLVRQMTLPEYTRQLLERRQTAEKPAQTMQSDG